METPKEATGNAELRDYLAVERTSLAWIRTGLALMGFGFVVARFGLFLAAFQATQARPVEASHRFSLASGIALIGVGVAVNLYSAWRHARLVEALNRGEAAGHRSSAQAVMVALFLALVGAAMGIYLTLIQS
jgi:putative membrane protein